MLTGCLLIIYDLFTFLDALCTTYSLIYCCVYNFKSCVKYTTTLHLTPLDLTFRQGQL